MDNTLTDPKYSSNYPSEVMYRSDKNFIVRLKAMIDRNMKAAGYSTSHSNEQFMKFIESISNAEDYLFDQPAPQGEGLYRWVKAIERLPEIISNEGCSALLCLRMDGDFEIGRYFNTGNDEYFMSSSLRLFRRQWFDRVQYLEPLPSQPQGEVGILIDGLKEVQIMAECTHLFEMVSVCDKALSSYQSSIKPINNE